MFVNIPVCISPLSVFQKHCDRQKANLRIRFKPSLFQHVGTHSSLAGKIQKLKVMTEHLSERSCIYITAGNVPLCEPRVPEDDHKHLLAADTRKHP